MGGINPAGDEFSKDGQSGCLIFFFIIQGILAMIGTIIRLFNGYLNICRWVWNSNKFSYSI
jgi:hypothetical protein